MRRTDRLFDLIQILRDGGLHRAGDMAQRFGVSTRTIWRDMEMLRASGVPVDGERGVGYRMSAPVTLPPLNLTLVELEALRLGIEVVAQVADRELQEAARSLATRIETVLPEHGAAPAAGWGVTAFPFAEVARGFTHMPTIRAALKARQKLRLEYRGLDGTLTERIVRPLQMDYWGRVWTLTAWCELRGDFRLFRVDRLEGLRPVEEHFEDEPGKTLADYLARYVQGPDGN